MAEYTHDELHRFLDLYSRPDASLSVYQKQALIDWDETPENVRDRLRTELGANPPAPGAAPLTSTEEQYARERGLTDEGQTRSWLDRMRDIFIRSR